MSKIIDLIPESQVINIATYKGCENLNSFLATDEEAHKLYTALIGKDRWGLVDMMNGIARIASKELKKFDGKEVTVDVTQHNKETISVKGIVGISPSIAFRDGMMTLYVDTGDKYTTKLYSIEEIHLIDN